MSSIEERFTRQIVRKTSNDKALAIVGAIVLFATYVVAAFAHAPSAVLLGVLAGSLVSLFIATRPSKGFRFLPDRIEELGPSKPSAIHYADIDRVQRIGDEVVIETGGRTVRLAREGSREPYVTDVVADLEKYLQASVAEAHALAEDRREVVAFLARGVPTGDDYRTIAAPRSALEAVARSRVMPARLRVDAARALGEEPPELPSNASETERRRV